MTLFGIPAATLLAWLLTLAFLGAGVVNALGRGTIKDDFVRWGYPRWWNLVTGALEVAAAATVVRCKDYGHVPPSIGLTVLSMLDLALIIK